MIPRHEAQTAWSIKNVPDAIAIKMAGFKSPQMRLRYTNIKPPRRGVHGRQTLRRPRKKSD
jgi:hypothetical protein